MAKAKRTVGPIRTPEGRLSFPHLRAPEETGQYASGKFITSFLIPKTADIQALLAACVQCAQNEWPTAGIVGPQQIRMPFKDGEGRPETAGHWIIKAKSTSRPTLVDGARNSYAGTVKGGDFARLAVLAFPWEQNLEIEMANALKAAGKTIMSKTDASGKVTNFRPAITFLLDSVQWLREGPALGGSGGGVGVFEIESAPVTGGLFDVE